MNTMNMPLLPALTGGLSVGSLDAYMHYVSQIPLLDAQEERELAEKFIREDSLEAARLLIISQLRYVVRIAKGYIGYGLALADLIQEGNIGLMKAVKRFNPSMGVRLVSFAVHWIKSEIHEFVIKNWRIVKIATTKAQRKLFFNLRQMKTRLGWFTQEEVAKVAEDLGVTQKDVLHMEARLNTMDAAFDAPSDTNGDEEESYSSPEHYLEDWSMNPANLLEIEQEKNGHNNLLHALKNLDDRSQNILQQRWLNEEKSTLHELASEYGVSAERIRQLEKQALLKLKSALKE